MKRGRGRPRKKFWEELNDENKAIFIKLYREGHTYAKMADDISLPDWKIKKIARELIAKGRIVFVDRIRKHRRKKTEKDPWNNNIFLYVLLSTRAGRSLSEMAKAMGKSYEWMRQKKKEAKGKFGWIKNTEQERQDKENKELIEVAAKELGTEAVNLERRLFGKRMKSGTKTEILVTVLEKYKKEKWGVCENCDQKFIRKQAGKRKFCYELKCKRKMESIAHKRTALKTGAAPINRKSLRTRWIVELFERLEKSNLSENDEWLTVKEAINKCGASQMQIRWLGQRRILTKGKHPVKRWRGQPVDVYPASQIRIINEILGPRR